MENVVNQLNQANPGVSYALNGNTITGSWNTNAAASGALGAQSLHMDYSVVVTLNPDMTFSYVEHMQSDNTNISAVGSADNNMGGNPLGDALGVNTPNNNPDAMNVFSSQSSSFSGKTFGNKQMGFSHQFGGKKGSNTISYSFDASKIKQPLFDALQSAGYHEAKKSFLKSLFGR